jgi:hypothetical protein
MKKLLLALSAACLLMDATAQTLTTPQPSPTQTLKQNFGTGSIELSYSRPSIKGRSYFAEKSDLAPVGEIWRTGANQATTLTFTDDVKIGDSVLKAGKYGMVSIPGKTDFTIIITKQLDVTSPSAYKKESDAVRLTVKRNQMPYSIESFTINFANISNNSCNVEITWGNTFLTFPIMQDVDKKVMAQIDNVFNKDTKPYFAAAEYYFNNGKDMGQALAWAKKATDLNPNAFWIHHLVAKINAKMGNKADAIAAATKSKEQATTQKNDDYVRMNEKLLMELAK